MTTETLPVVVPLEPTTPIRPSEAIRLGCLLAPVQDFGRLGNGNRACVMGAMVIGFGGAGDLEATTRAFNVRTTLKAPCPECGRVQSEAALITPAHLNDDHRWSRERIADWLADQGL